jgi:hypothetical protein
MMSDALLAQSAVDRPTSGAHTLVIEGPSPRQRAPHRRAAIDVEGEAKRCSLTPPGGPMLVATGWSHHVGKRHESAPSGDFRTVHFVRQGNCTDRLSGPEVTDYARTRFPARNDECEAAGDQRPRPTSVPSVEPGALTPHGCHFHNFRNMARLPDSMPRRSVHSGRVNTSRNSWLTKRSSLPTLTSLSSPASTRACSQDDAV